MYSLMEYTVSIDIFILLLELSRIMASGQFRFRINSETDPSSEWSMTSRPPVDWKIFIIIQSSNTWLRNPGDMGVYERIF